VGFTTESKKALEKTKGFRAMELTEEELVAQVRERLRKPLERSEVWYVWLSS
jgi:hypothetical protein